MMNRKYFFALAIIFLACPAELSAQQSIKTELMVRTCDGKDVFGIAGQATVSIQADGHSHSIELANLLSLHSALPATELEQQSITSNLAVLDGTDLAKSEQAAAELADIGLPVISPLLKNFPDTDAHMPDYRYRLFGRILPGHADGLDRSLDLVRLADGTTLRGNLADTNIIMVDEEGRRQVIPTSNIRRIAVLKETISRTIYLDALHHCTYVGLMDCGIFLTEQSSLICDARGFVRLSFDEDGWSADPDGIFEPLEGKRKLQEGFRWGSVLGKVGPSGERWFVGKHLEKSDAGSGRLYLVINDNEHWQNNIGSYRVQLVVKNAFDVGEPW